MSDKPNTPVIIDDGESITVKVGEITRKFYRSNKKYQSNRYHQEIIIALAEEVNKLRYENDALKKEVIQCRKYLGLTK